MSPLALGTETKELQSMVKNLEPIGLIELIF